MPKSPFFMTLRTTAAAFAEAATEAETIRISNGAADVAAILTEIMIPVASHADVSNTNESSHVPF